MTISLLAGFGATLVAMLVIDTLALTMLMRPHFERHVPNLLAETPNYLAAAAFYILYVGVITYLAIWPALSENWSLQQLLGRAVVLGLFAYGTFELTSMAVMRNWAWSMVAIDMAWGTVLTATIAAIGVWAARVVG